MAAAQTCIEAFQATRIIMVVSMTARGPSENDSQEYKETIMIKRALAMTLAVVLIHTLIAVQPASASPKSDKESQLAGKVKAGILKLGVGKDSIVEVRLQDKTRLTGYISEANDESFVVANDETGSSVSVPYADVTKVKGNNLSTGAKIGIGIAIGFLLTVAVIFLIKG